MSNFVGRFENPSVQLSAANLAYGPTSGTAQKLSLRSGDVAGAVALGSPVDAPQDAAAGVFREMFGGTCIFERVLIVPQRIDAGAVLSTLTFPVDVWNTFRNVEESLTGLIVAGPGNAIVDLPPLPVVLHPLGAISVNVILPTSGDAQIGETIEFVFPGIVGTILTLTGNRIAVFTIEANWGDDGINEKPQLWFTGVLTSQDGSEQRSQLRTMPRSQVRFRISPDHRGRALMESLLWGWQSRIYGVPFWPDAQPLMAGVNPGDTVLLFNTAHREFLPGASMILWRDPLTYEAITIVGVVAGGVQVVAAGAHGSWAADGKTVCVPLRKGRLADVQDVTRTTSTLAEAVLTFDCEVV